jgi:erythromycin esterase-like protein
MIKQISTVISNYDIIGLGEATHGNYKNAVFRSKLIKHLITHHSIREIVLEDDIIVVNKIMKAPDKLTQLMPYLMFPWDNKIIEDLFTWVFEWNRKNPKVSVYGVDATGVDSPFKHTLPPSIIKKYNKMKEEQYDKPSRDKNMSEFFEDMHDPSKKSVLIFHNSHLSYSGYQKLMGYYIKQKFDKYFVLANSFTRGSFSGSFYDKRTKKGEYQVISVDVKDPEFNKDKDFLYPPPAYVWLPDSYVDSRDPYKYFFKKKSHGYDAVLLINDEKPLHSFKEQDTKA